MKPRRIIAKFMSRRMKALVMATCKRLKPIKRQYTISPDAEPADNEDDCNDE